ncbi:MAG TPA: ATP-binding protein, partial [Nitrospira sp.]
TPLNAIMGIADYLARTPLNEDQLALVERCTKASDGLLRMIEDLLLAAKAESGTLALLSEPFVLKKILSECTDLLVNEAHDKDLSLTVDLDPSLPAVVTGDAYRLQQILLNLIRNAIKFTSSGSIEIHAKPRSVEPDVCYVEFTVTDTGIGISDDLRQRLFLRFSQADSRANRHYGGVGLGLSICKQLVDLMGGKIFVESTPGKGSAFSVTIPLGTAIESASDVPPHSSTGKIRAFRSTRLLPVRKLKILLAEDCIESQRVMRLYVNKTPHQLDCAETGAAVVERFKGDRYDLVLMDLHMPDMDGCEATRMIRAWELEHGRPRTPIVALTADGFAESKQKSLDAGCDDFVTKPIKMDMVLGILQRYAAATKPSQQPLPLNRPQPLSSDDALNAELHLLKPKFIHNRHRDVSALRTAIDTVNYTEIEIIGHRIKGIAGSYGLHAMGAIGAALERAAKEHRLEHIVASVAELVEAIKEAEQTCSSHSGASHHNRTSKGAAS